MRFRAVSLGQYQADEEFRKSRALRVGQKGGVLSCAFCRGQGSGRAFGQCTACGGRGEVTIAEPFRRCHFCGGTGKATQGTTFVCPVCRGRGAVTISEEQEDCPSCGGKGRTRGATFPCFQCRGTGTISKAKEHVSTA
jgi:DnaJ-class molecular chaperone